MSDEVTLRDIVEADLPAFFEHQNDKESTRMAAFTPRDRDGFMAHWLKILADPTTVTKAILVGGELAGNTLCFHRSGKRQVGYWLGREYWGRGVATRALALLLDAVEERPLYAFAARHNIASHRVLEKNGFERIGIDPHPFGAVDGVEDVIFILRE